MIKNADVKDIESGPVDENHRQCRDIICILFLIAILAATVYFAIHGFSKGNPKTLFRGISTSGQLCGYPGTGW